MSWGETIFLSKIIKSQRCYGVSDENIITLLTNPINYGDDYDGYFDLNFTPKVDGTLRVKIPIRIYAAANSHSSTLTIKIAKNGEIIESFPYKKATIKGGSSTSNTLEEIWDLDIPINKNSTYTVYVRFSTSKGNATIKSISLCGSIVDLSMLKYKRSE